MDVFVVVLVACFGKERNSGSARFTGNGLSFAVNLYYIDSYPTKTRYSLHRIARDIPFQEYPGLRYPTLGASRLGISYSRCYICLLEYEEGDSMRIFACNHEFHRTCIDKWLKEVHRSITWVVVTLHMLELPKDDAGIKYSLLVQQPLEWHASACRSTEIDNICEIMVDGFPDYHMETSNPIDGFPDYHTNSAVRKDNKQRFSLLEENGELLICANQGHTTVESERLLKQILSADEVQCKNIMSYIMSLRCICILFQFNTEGYLLRLPLPECWVVSKLHMLIDAVTESYNKYFFGDVGREIYDFFWGDFADRYPGPVDKKNQNRPVEQLDRRQKIVNRNNKWPDILGIAYSEMVYNRNKAGTE
ncbi:hypothetical protein GOBAR_DD33672 [Gossypium barbadense]|nr:hypothetical protein GOBAR_DD33672 [Gossypium barbadense]